MRVLLFLLSFTLAVGILTSELAFVIDRTVSVATIDGAASRSGFYAGAATAVSDSVLRGNIASNSAEDLAERKTRAAAIAKIATPEYLRSKVLDIGAQFEELLKADRESATLDLSELADGLRAQGIRMPAEDFKTVVTASQIDDLVKTVHA